MTACKSNLKNLGTALEMYSTDNEGHYPAALAALTPDYLKVIPICAAAEKDTYSNTYACAIEPDAYTMVCQGKYHTGASLDVPNYPQYTSMQGLIERP